MDGMCKCPCTPTKSLLEVEVSDVSTEMGRDDTDLELIEDCPGPHAFFVFDWDDTLLPTTWLHMQGLLVDDTEDDIVASEMQQGQLQRLVTCALDTLSAALRCGSVIIITNAEDGWVETSCQKYMPALACLLSEVSIVSARSAYEQHGIFAPSMWKRRAFESEINNILAAGADRTPLHVISVGDSLYEQEALVWATKDMHNCYAKSLKFEERPDIEKLIEEHELVSSCLSDVVGHNGNLDLEIGAEQ